MANPVARAPVLGQGSRASIDLAAVLAALDAIVGAPDPDVVFASVARLCVPAVCDAVTVVLEGPRGAVRRITWPRPEPSGRDQLRPEPVLRTCGDAPRSPGAVPLGGSRITATSVITVIERPSIGAEPAYEGALALQFSHGRPTPVDAVLAQLIVERAVAVIERARLVEQVAAAHARSDNLDVALSTSREIGIAMGIVMSRFTLTSAQAFDLLRRVSQQTNRKLRDVAAEVAETGTIDLPRGAAVTTGEPGRSPAR